MEEKTTYATEEKESMAWDISVWSPEENKQTFYIWIERITVLNNNGKQVLKEWETWLPDRPSSEIMTLAQ